MNCKDCGEQLDGDGYKRVFRCPNGPESGEGSGEFDAFFEFDQCQGGRGVNDYKLVPVRPTPEMCHAAEAALDDDQSWPAIWEEILDVAPDVQGEPVAAQVRYRRPEKGLPSWSAWQPAKVDETKPTYHFDEQGWEVEYRLLYAVPQPEPDVDVLVEALEELVDLMQGVIDGDYEPDSLTLQPATIALSAYRKGGEV